MVQTLRRNSSTKEMPASIDAGIFVGDSRQRSKDRSLRQRLHNRHYRLLIIKIPLMPIHQWLWRVELLAVDH